MDESILTSIKKCLGISEDYTEFDSDIIIFINSAIASLVQIGIGSSDGFSVEDKNDSWEDFVSDTNQLELIKTYIYTKVKILFDPPSSSYVLEALKEVLKENEWRLSVYANKKEVTT